MKFLARDVNLLKSSIQNFDRQSHHQVVPWVKIDIAKILEIKNNGELSGVCSDIPPAKMILSQNIFSLCFKTEICRWGLSN
jgi:hypothetical protein